MRILYSTVMCVVLQLVFLCSPATANGPEHDEVGLAIWNPISTLDPVYTTTTGQFVLFDALFEGLLKKVEDKVVPAHAETMEISEDGKRYTFRLRDGLVWDDGISEIAGDYVLAFQRLVDPAVNAEPRPNYLITNIKNATAIRNGEAPVDTLGISAPDDKTVVIDLERPNSFFPEILTYPGLAPVPSHLIRKYGDDWWKQPSVVSNGVYHVIERDENGGLLIEARNGTQKLESPHRAHVYFVKDAGDALHMMINGKLDIAHYMEIDHQTWLSNRLGFQRITVLLPGTTYAIFNTRRKKLADKRVRQALAMAINREDLAKATISELATTFVPPSMLDQAKSPLIEGFDSLAYSERQVKARALLAEAGYTAENPLELAISCSKKLNYDTFAIAIRSMFAKIGVTAKVDVVPSSQYSAILAAKEFDISIASWIADYNDGMTFYAILQTGASKNHSGFSNAEFDRLAETALSMHDEQKRQELYVRMENILQEEVPIVPLKFHSHTTIAHPRVKSIGTTNFSSISIHDIRVAPKLN